MRKHQFSIWVAFADVAFILFIGAVIAASGYRADDAKQQERANLAERGKNKAIAQLRRALRCSDAQPLFSDLSSCLASTISTAAAAHSDLCSVTLREDLLRFETGSARPIDGARAAAVATCVYTAVRNFDHDHHRAAATIRSISIDGYTDCQGELVSNMDLGSQRAATLFRLVLGAMKRDEARSDSTEQYLLSKLAVRSYGQQRPVPASRCAQLGSFGGDRRVTIAVEMTPMTSTEEVNDAR
jgi:outer membrane protein OmpA-like peptidoglycan-associated protein